MKCRRDKGKFKVGDFGKIFFSVLTLISFCRGRNTTCRCSKRFTTHSPNLLWQKPEQVDIEKGMRKGDTITYQAAGDQKAKQVPGDIVFRVNEQEHKFFKRKGDNLLGSVKISLKEALLGFQRESVLQTMLQTS